MNESVGVEVKLYTFLTLAIDEDDRLALLPGLFVSQYPLNKYQDYVDPTASLDVSEKRKISWPCLDPEQP
jgi:hypothetical protein